MRRVLPWKVEFVGKEKGEHLFFVDFSDEQWALLKAAKNASGIHRWEKFFDMIIREYLERRWRGESE